MPEFTEKEIEAMVDVVEEKSLFPETQKDQLVAIEKEGSTDVDIATVFMHCFDQFVRMKNNFECAAKCDEIAKWYEEERNADITKLRYYVQERKRIQGGIGTFHYERKMSIKIMLYRAHFVDFISFFKRLVKMEEYIEVK